MQIATSEGWSMRTSIRLLALSLASVLGACGGGDRSSSDVGNVTSEPADDLYYIVEKVNSPRCVTEPCPSISISIRAVNQDETICPMGDASPTCTVQSIELDALELSEEMLAQTLDAAMGGEAILRGKIIQQLGHADPSDPGSATDI